MPDPRRTAVFTDLGSIGVKALHGPLIGAEIFVSGLHWADDEVYSATIRLRRYGAFIRPYPLHQPIKTIGYQFLNGQAQVPGGRVTPKGPHSHTVELPQDWAIAIKREWDQRDEAGRKALRKQINPLIGEWCDTLIVGSHVGYGNDIFCTADEGKGAGSGSLLHHSNRANLKQQGVTIMSPRELVNSVL